MNYYHKIEYEFIRHPFFLITLVIFLTKIPKDTDLGGIFFVLTLGSWIHWLVIVSLVGFILNRICRRQLYRETFEHVRKKSEYFESSEEKILESFRGHKKDYEEWKEEWLTSEEKKRIEDETDEFSISSVYYNEIDKLWKESKFYGTPRTWRVTPLPRLEQCYRRWYSTRW